MSNSQPEARISLYVTVWGEYELVAAEKQGYSERVRKNLSYETAWQIAKVIDELAGTAHFARNIVGDGKDRREKRVKELEEARNRIDQQIAELEK